MNKDSVYHCRQVLQKDWSQESCSNGICFSNEDWEWRKESYKLSRKTDSSWSNVSRPWVCILSTARSKSARKSSKLKVSLHPNPTERLLKKVLIAWQKECLRQQIADEQAVLTFKTRMPLKQSFHLLKRNMVIFRIAREQVCVRRKIFNKWLKTGKALKFWRSHGRVRELDNMGMLCLSELKVAALKHKSGNRKIKLTKMKRLACFFHIMVLHATT